MRAEPELIAPRIVSVPGAPARALLKIRGLVEDDWKCRVLDTDYTGTVMITAPYHFTTDTSFGQPAGGRKYYTQLRIEVFEKEGSTQVRVSPYNFEIRSSYAFNNYTRGGEVGTLYKHYPYEEYPGMFDLDLINKEMDRVAMDIQRLFREYK
jgi:hypothetical protein